MHGPLAVSFSSGSCNFPGQQTNLFGCHAYMQCVQHRQAEYLHWAAEEHLSRQDTSRHQFYGHSEVKLTVLYLVFIFRQKMKCFFLYVEDRFKGCSIYS